MLVNGIPYLEEVKKKQLDTWYDEKYKYYHGEYNTIPGWDFSDEGDYNTRFFASVDSKGELLGFIKYGIDRLSNCVNGFGAMNFSDNKFTFAKDMARAVDEIFTKFNHQAMEWYVIVGNPIEKSYDKLCKGMGGCINSYRRRSDCINGVLHDSKSYMVLRENYLKNRAFLVGEKRYKEEKDSIIPISVIEYEGNKDYQPMISFKGD